MAITSPNIEHLSVVMTTETVYDITHTTAANIGMASPSRGIAFYFQCAVVVIGVVGMAANALILHAMAASKQHKKHVLIFHQNVIDFLGCFFLVITYSVKLGNIYFTGSGLYWLCILFHSENLIWGTILASKVNLMIVTIDRYLKVVYPVCSKTKLRGWILHSAVAFAWISSLVHLFALTIKTTVVAGGMCYAYVLWISPMAHVVYLVWSSLSFYVVALIIFIFCYWRILAAIRRQAHVMAGHNAGGSSTAQSHFSQIQISVNKTMILVSAFYAISDMPRLVYGLLIGFRANVSITEGGYYATVFISFLYICTNPFIYAMKFDPVKRVLLSLIPCKTTPVQPIENIEMNAPRRAL